MKFQLARQIAAQNAELNYAHTLASLGGLGSRKSNLPGLFDIGERVTLSDGTTTLDVPVEVLIDYISKNNNGPTKHNLYGMITSENKEKFNSLLTSDAGSSSTGKEPAEIIAEIESMRPSTANFSTLPFIPRTSVPPHETKLPDFFYNIPNELKVPSLLTLLNKAVHLSSANSASITAHAVDSSLKELIKKFVLEDLGKKEQLKKLDGLKKMLHNMLDSIHNFHMFGIDAPHDFLHTVHELLEYINELYTMIIKNGCILTAEDVSKKLDKKGLSHTYMSQFKQNKIDIIEIGYDGEELKLSPEQAVAWTEMKKDPIYAKLQYLHVINKQKRSRLFTRNGNVCQTACHAEAVRVTDECIEQERELFGGNISDRVRAVELEHGNKFNTNEETLLEEQVKFLLFYNDRQVRHLFVESCMSRFIREVIMKRGKETVGDIATKEELAALGVSHELPLMKNILLSIKKIDAGCGCGKVSDHSFRAVATNTSHISKTTCIASSLTGRANSNVFDVKTKPVRLAGGVFHCEVSSDYKYVTCTSFDGVRLIYFGGKAFSVDAIQATLGESLLRGKEKTVEKLKNMVWFIPKNLKRDVIERSKRCMLKALKSLTDYIQLTTVSELENAGQSLVTAVSDNIANTMARGLGLRHVAFEQHGSIDCNSYRLHGDMERIRSDMSQRVDVLVSCFDNLPQISKRVVEWKSDTQKIFKLMYRNSHDPALCFATTASFEKIWESTARLEAISAEMYGLAQSLQLATTNPLFHKETFKTQCLAFLPAMTGIDHFVDNIIGQNECSVSFLESLNEGKVQCGNVTKFFKNTDNTPNHFMDVMNDVLQYIVNSSLSEQRNDDELINGMTICAVVLFALKDIEYNVINTKCMNILNELLVDATNRNLSDDEFISRTHRNAATRFPVIAKMKESDTFEKILEKRKSAYQNPIGQQCLWGVICILYVVNGLEANVSPFEFKTDEILSQRNLPEPIEKIEKDSITNWLGMIRSNKIRLNETEDNSFMSIVYRFLGRKIPNVEHDLQNEFPTGLHRRHTSSSAPPSAPRSKKPKVKTEGGTRKRQKRKNQTHKRQPRKRQTRNRKARKALKTRKI